MNSGILLLALENMFDIIENDMEKTYFVHCSFFEIYND